MEQITKRDGKFFYGSRQCHDAEEAYRRFRDDYHKGLGKRVFRRLDRPPRVERVHEFGFCFADERKVYSGKRVPSRLLGLVDISYCRIIGIWDFPELDEREFEQWLDRLLARGSKVLKYVGRNDKSGRTSKLLNKRYR